MKYCLFLLLAVAVVAGVWRAAPERAPAAPRAVATAAARDHAQRQAPPLDPDGCQADRRVAVPPVAAERIEAVDAAGPATADSLPPTLEALERERQRVVDELFERIESAAEERFLRGEFELAADGETRPEAGIQVVRRAPTGLYRHVELARADHPELYALRDLAESLRTRIEAGEAAHE